MNETEQRRERECMKMRIDDLRRENERLQLSRDADAMEIERLRQQLRYQDARDGTIGAHYEGCWASGPRHYDCAVAEIERING